jgi:hypothetical protein
VSLVGGLVGAQGTAGHLVPGGRPAQRALLATGRLSVDLLHRSASPPLIRWSARRRCWFAVVTAGLTFGAAACSGSGSAAPTRLSVGSASSPSAGADVMGHVHGIGVGLGEVLYLASHTGLHQIKSGVDARVRPDIDLMGFAVAGPNHFYASGHPGAASTLPNPVGLIESTDGGKSWTPRSLTGQVDFHTVAVSGRTVVGFDGELRISTDGGSTWRRQPVSTSIYAVAVSPAGDVILAATNTGVISVSPAGPIRTLPGAPKVDMLSWAVLSTVVGVSAVGEVYISSDAGLTWKHTGAVGAPVQAMVALPAGEGNLEIFAATEVGIMQSTDSGGHFTPYPAS